MLAGEMKELDALCAASMMAGRAAGGLWWCCSNHMRFAATSSAGSACSYLKCMLTPYPGPLLTASDTGSVSCPVGG